MKMVQGQLDLTENKSARLVVPIQPSLKDVVAQRCAADPNGPKDVAALVRELLVGWVRKGGQGRLFNERDGE